MLFVSFFQLYSTRDIQQSTCNDLIVITGDSKKSAMMFATAGHATCVFSPLSSRYFSKDL